MNSCKKRIAVMFGGISPEHDVSVITGIQALNALDPEKYDAFPVYVDCLGHMRVGDILLDTENYMLSQGALSKTKRVVLDACGILRHVDGGFFGKTKSIEFDAALLAFHGGAGEAGGITGACDLLRIPYTGMSTLGCAVSMDKIAAKTLLRGLDIPVLDDAIIDRPSDGTYSIDKARLTEAIGDLQFPLCVKPVHMGSSIGAAKVCNIGELRACLPAIFEYDTHAMVEPFIENLIEYNIAAAAWGLSAIEKPKTSAELLDFKTKYCSGEGEGKLGGTKSGGSPISQGMIEMTRDIPPQNLPKETAEKIRSWAGAAFSALGNKGAPRMDFYGDAKTGEIWMNEINPYPGSLGYFLWEAADKPLLFTEFLNSLIDEAFERSKSSQLPLDPVPQSSRLLTRNGNS